MKTNSEIIEFAKKCDSKEQLRSFACDEEVKIDENLLDLAFMYLKGETEKIFELESV